MKIHVFLFVSVLCFCPSLARAASKSELIQELMRVQGLQEMIEQARIANEAQVQQAAQRMIQELRTQFSSVPEPLMKDLMGAVERFTRNAAGGWTASEAVERWEQLYGAGMSAEDVAKVLEFCKSPVGQKDIAATKAAMPKWGAFFAERGAATMDRAMKAYVAEVQQIVSRASPRKK